MNIRTVKLGVTLAAFVFSGGASALAINDPGVVGTIWTGTQSQNVSNQIQWAQYLLDLGASMTVTVDANTPLDGDTEDYATSSTDYNAILTDGFRQDGGVLTGWTDYEYVLGKYNGKNGGIMLFNVGDYVAASGTSLPQFSYPIWGDKSDKYQLSHWTGFNKNGVPEPGPLALLAIGLMGIGMSRLKKVS